jgi:diaminopimelate epimerase
MRLAFTKMQGAGNDFVVLDGREAAPALSQAQYRRVADRRFGIGADQILIIGPAAAPENDFSYRIVNADGGEVEHCGNGARCFLRYVRSHGLTNKSTVRVEVSFGVLELSELPDGNVDVQIAVPRFEPADIPCLTADLAVRTHHQDTVYALPLSDSGDRWISLVNLGNPHAVQLVDDVDTAPVMLEGPEIETHERFPARVNAGFMQVIGQHTIKLRVWERGVGETLACGTGACAAVVAGIRRGLLASPVKVHARGGDLTVTWDGPGTMVRLAGPAATVFEGEIEL